MQIWILIKVKKMLKITMRIIKVNIKKIWKIKIRKIRIRIKIKINKIWKL